MVKEYEHGIQDKAILFTNKCGFVYKIYFSLSQNQLKNLSF